MMCQPTINSSIQSYYKGDPTKTAGIKRSYEGALYKRFRRLKGRITNYIVKENKLSVDTNPVFNIDMDFETSPERIEEFLEWLSNQINSGILDLYAGEEQSVTSGDWWADAYIQKGYGKGMDHGASSSKRLGIEVPGYPSTELLMASPFHIDRLGILFTRNFEGLNKITKEMSDQIGEILAEGISQGWNPNRIAQAINNRVDKIGIHRARLLARTEVMNAHAEATLNMYESLGFDEAELQAEWLTAGDIKVCPLCAPNDGKVFTIKKARGLIPVHPNCRCVWTPAQPE